MTNEFALKFQEIFAKENSVLAGMDPFRFLITSW